MRIKNRNWALNYHPGVVFRRLNVPSDLALRLADTKIIGILKTGGPLGLKLLPVLVLLAISITLYPSAGRDDAYITYWAAHALANFGEIVNYNGERVEQSSSLLHVLLLAAATRLTTVEIPTLGPIISMLAAVATLIYTRRLAALFMDGLLPVLASILVATSTYFSYWATGGLETSLTALIYTALAYYYIRYLRGAKSGRPRIGLWLLMASALLVRPESVFVVGAALLGYLFASRIRTMYGIGADGGDDRSTIKKVSYLLLTVIIIGALILVFRLVYFGSPFPQPVVAKVTGISASEMARGWKYLYDVLVEPYHIVVYVAALAGVLYSLYRVIWRAQSITAVHLVMLLLLAQGAFIVLTGGDWMEGARFVVPVIPLVAVLAVALVSRVFKKEFVLPALVVLAALQVPGSLLFALSSSQSSSQSMPLWEAARMQTDFQLDGFSWFDKANHMHLRDIPMVRELDSVVNTLNESGAGPVSIMSGQAGMSFTTSRGTITVSLISSTDTD